jgi:hypothetical protein
MGDVKKRKLHRLSWLVEIKDGKMLAPRPRMVREIAELADVPEAELVLTQAANPKTHRQLRTLHGPIIEQLQNFYMADEGVYKSIDRIKHELKAQFLQPVKRYWDDGSPVILRITHPTKRGIKMDWHMEELPSLASLDIEQMNSFIAAIVEYFLHERGWVIEIDPDKADPKYHD